MNDYHINVFWSEEDQSWVADSPDFAKCSAMGDSPEEAVHDVLLAEHAWIESAKDHGDPIPSLATGRRSMQSPDFGAAFEEGVLMVKSPSTGRNGYLLQTAWGPLVQPFS